jgi:hypothetical protein
LARGVSATTLYVYVE